MTLDEAVKVLETIRPVWPEVGNCPFAPTGDEYVTIMSGGVKAEGENAPCLCSSPELATKLWLAAVLEYASNHQHGTLYWRIRPESDGAYFAACDNTGDVIFQTVKDRLAFTNKRYVVYSRLLISDKPRIRPAVVDRTSDSNSQTLVTQNS